MACSSVGTGHFQTSQRNRAGVLAIQAFEPVAVLPALQFFCLRGADVATAESMPAVLAPI